jgi:endogenous inhibitor of DNA gyrase (YacG/DUF329 family)
VKRARRNSDLGSWVSEFGDRIEDENEDEDEDDD